MGAGTAMLDPQANPYSIASDDLLAQTMLKRATRNNLYCAANSNTVNGYIHGTQEIESWPHFRTVLIVIDVVLGLGAAALIFNVVRILRKKEQA